MLVTVSDKKLVVPIFCDPIIDRTCQPLPDGSYAIVGYYYKADVITAVDYYPFGSQMPGRKYTVGAGQYRYGFNGKEKDNEIEGEGNIYDYGFRIYSSRLGRFLSVDPLSDKYPWYTPYQFAGNKPIWCVDLDGLEDIPANGGHYYSMAMLLDMAMNDIRVSSAIDRGETVMLHQVYNVMSGGKITQFDKISTLSQGVVGSKIGIVTQEAEFYRDGSLRPSGITQTYHESGIFKGTPPPPEPPLMPQSPPNPPIAAAPENKKTAPAIKKQKATIPKPQNPPKPNPPASHPKPKPPKPSVAVTPPVAAPPFVPPPATPNPHHMCFVCFNGASLHYKDAVKEIVTWLKDNPNYNLKITADGGSSTLVDDTWQDKPVFTKETYEQHTNKMFKRLVDAVNQAGGDGSRIIPQKGNADGDDLKYTPIRR